MSARYGIEYCAECSKKNEGAELCSPCSYNHTLVEWLQEPDITRLKCNALEAWYYKHKKTVDWFFHWLMFFYLACGGLLYYRLEREFGYIAITLVGIAGLSLVACAKLIWEPLLERKIEQRLEQIRTGKAVEP